MYHRFGHLKEEPLVKVGEWVKKGQMIGRVGNTGNSTAPHLHYDIFVNQPERWTFYSKGMSAQEVKETWLDPKEYMEGDIPAPFTHKGWGYLDWTGNLHHTGKDINEGTPWGDLGNPIQSTVDGQVEHVRFYEDWGWLLIIREDMKKNPNLIKQKDKPEIYYTNGKKKFHIPDWYTFTNLRYAMEEVTEVDDVSSIPNGDPFPSLDPEGSNPLPDEFRREIAHESQGRYPICVAMAITRLAELQYRIKYGEEIHFSAKAFYIESSGQGGGISHTYAYNTAVEKGFVLEADCPTGDLGEKRKNWLEEWRADVANISPDAKRYKPKSHKTIAPREDRVSEEELQIAIYEEGGFTANVDTDYAGWDNGENNPTDKFSPSHTVIYTGYEADNWTGYNHWESKPEIKTSKNMHMAWLKNFNW